MKCDYCGAEMLVPAGSIERKREGKILQLCVGCLYKRPGIKMALVQLTETYERKVR
jgi:hypothetical protein